VRPWRPPSRPSPALCTSSSPSTGARKSTSTRPAGSSPPRSTRCRAAAALPLPLLIDRDCNETLQTVEFANLQLLEYRQLDDRLDDSLAAAYRAVQPPRRAWWPLFWRTHAKSLRLLGTLKVEAHGLFERTGSVLKLVGDQYLARVYRLVARRLHLEEWQQSIQRSLEVAEGVYQVVSDQAAANRTEALEAIVVLLILVEIVLALLRH